MNGKIQYRLSAVANCRLVRLENELHHTLSAATSPPTRTWQYSLAILVDVNVTISTESCGRQTARARVQQRFHCHDRNTATRRCT